MERQDLKHRHRYLGFINGTKKIKSALSYQGFLRHKIVLCSEKTFFGVFWLYKLSLCMK